MGVKGILQHLQYKVDLELHILDQYKAHKTSGEPLTDAEWERAIECQLHTFGAAYRCLEIAKQYAKGGDQ